MSSWLWIAIAIVLVFLVSFEFCKSVQETYSDSIWPYDFYVHAGPIMTSGSTRNMSYDIRGDSYIPYTGAGPWSGAGRFPIRNRRMIIGGA